MRKSDIQGRVFCLLIHAVKHRLDGGDEALTGTYVSLMLHGGKFFNCSLNRPHLFHLVFASSIPSRLLKLLSFVQRRLKVIHTVGLWKAHFKLLDTYSSLVYPSLLVCATFRACMRTSGSPFSDRLAASCHPLFIVYTLESVLNLNLRLPYIARVFVPYAFCLDCLHQNART